MNHPFVKSLTDDTCARCRKAELMHTDKAICEACGSVGTVDMLGDPTNPKMMLLCSKCMKAEYQASIARAKEHSDNWEQDKINTAVTNPIGAILRSVEIDKALEVKEDFFNAETTSIIELQSAVTSSVNFENLTEDEAKIARENSNYELAKLIQQRFNHFKSVLFEMKSAEQNLLSRQRAIAVYLNDLAGKLSAEKRAELKIQDINYKPLDKPAKSANAVTKPRLTIEERMATNLFNSKLNKAAQSLVDDKTCKDLEEGLKVAKARGLGISMDKARELVRATLR
jgi:hypothetical protein